MNRNGTATGVFVVIAVVSPGNGARAHVDASGCMVAAILETKVFGQLTLRVRKDVGYAFHAKQQLRIADDTKETALSCTVIASVGRL